MTENPYKIKDVDLSKEEIRQKFARELDAFLGPYTDPEEEMSEALDSARKDGFIFEAVDPEGQRLGAVVITRSPFQSFQPQYHLAYIATSSEARGKGIGKLLLQECIQRTNGEIALHVSPKNEKAIAFYEHLGWEIKYVRMMPAVK